MKIALTTIAIASMSAGALGGDPWVVTTDDSFNSFGAEMPYGDGNLNENFTIARTTDSFGDIEIGLKAKERFVGPISNVGSRYFAEVGSPNNDGRASWNIDYGFALPQAALPSNYTLLLNVDFDSGFGSTSFVTLDITQSLENFFQNVSSGGDSQNLDFGFWGTTTSGPLMLDLDASGHIVFDADALGEYDINMELYNPAGSLIARTDIVVEVVPAPGAMALLGLGALGVSRRRR